MIGSRFGMLVVLSKDIENTSPRMWHCECGCGTLKTVRADHLRGGKIVSCGCYRRAAVKKSKTSHGKSKTRTYRIWRNMITRCTNPNYAEAKYYSDRGITVCERWLSSFENFLADMGESLGSLSIDRINNDGNYEPTNCRWATAKEQCVNRRKPLGVQFRAKEK